LHHEKRVSCLVVTSHYRYTHRVEESSRMYAAANVGGSEEIDEEIAVRLAEANSALSRLNKRLWDD